MGPKPVALRATPLFPHDFVVTPSPARGEGEEPFNSLDLQCA
jgi:hypothetical protein